VNHYCIIEDTMQLTTEEYNKIKADLKAEIVVEISGLKTNELPTVTAVADNHLFVIADKDSGKAYQATERQLKDAIAVNADFRSAVPTTVPTNAKDGTVYYPTVPGTYTNFKDQTNTALPFASTDGLTYFIYNGTFWTKVASSTNLANYTLKTDTKMIADGQQDAVSTPIIDKAAQSTSVGFLSKTDGHLVTAAEDGNTTNWLSTDFIPVNDLTTVEWNNVNMVAYNGALFVFYNAAKVFISHYSPVPTTPQQIIKVSDRQAGAKFVRCSGRHVGADPFHVYSTIQIRSDAVDGLPAVLTTVSNRPARDYALEPLFSAYLNTSGVYTANTSYRSTDYIPVVTNQEINYTGVAGTASVPVCYYDANKVFVAPAPLAVNKTYTAQKLNVPTGVVFVRMCSRANAGDVYNFKVSFFPTDPKLVTTVQTNTDNIASLFASINNFYTMKDFSTGLFTGNYLDLNGQPAASGVYAMTDFITVKTGYPMSYKGFAGPTVCPVAYYNSSKAFIVSGLLAADYQATPANLIVPNNAAIAYVRMCARINTGDVLAFTIGTPATSTGGGGGTAPSPLYLMPTVGYGKQGELFRLYPFGVIAKNPNDLSNSADVIWSVDNSGNDFWEMTPGASDDNINVQLSTRDYFDTKIDCGTMQLKVTHTTRSPAAPINIINIGDSVTEGSGSNTNPTDGAWTNEFSRRLTGVGAAIPSTPSPAALNLANIYFRGTLGSLTIKHEGRSGWSTQDYLTQSSNNAFWNPATSKFDLAYYLSHNNFNAAQTTGGVDATGSNLVLYIFLGWNDTRNYGVDQAMNYMNQLLDIIHTSHPACSIKLLGLTRPPAIYMRAGGRINNSAHTAMYEQVIPLAKNWQTIANARSTYVEFVPQAPFFNPLECFATASHKLHNRSATSVNYLTDYVHPNNQGHGQIADIAFMNFLYNYCRAS
jgi:lysophospholipase L1-like esterase